MPEGDTIHHTADRIRSVLAGRIPEEILTPHPRHGAERWPLRHGGEVPLSERWPIRVVDGNDSPVSRAQAPEAATDPARGNRVGHE
jgi:hypothetical protein